MTKDKMTRGMKNNNPFNIRKSANPWLGKLIGQDKDFETFETLNLGVRAGLLNLLNAYFKPGLTLRQIVAKYAPGSDNNNEQSYLDFLVKSTGVIPEQIPTKEKWLPIAQAIMKMEQGFQVKSYDELVTISRDFNLLSYL